MSKRFLAGILLVLLLLAGGTLPAEEMWRPKAEATSFVPNWSSADKADGEATDFFLKNIWPPTGEARGGNSGYED
ncbi:MAG: hypothetical protein V1899_00115 [Planctomycetota bacterium]